MPPKIATVVGATGLIGNALVEILEADSTYSQIRVPVRRVVAFTQSKADVRLINFEDYESLKISADGADVVFCCVGTTTSKVQGDMTAYRKVDFDIPVKLAQICEETRCPHFMVVSSVGADASGNNFYLKMKGEMENAVLEKKIPSISILRPSQLVGRRNESRPREEVVQWILRSISFALPSRYKPIEARQVAKAMLEISKSQRQGNRIYENEELLQFK